MHISLSKFLEYMPSGQLNLIDGPVRLTHTHSESHSLRVTVALDSQITLLFHLLMLFRFTVTHHCPVTLNRIITLTLVSHSQSLTHSPIINTSIITLSLVLVID